MMLLLSDPTSGMITNYSATLIFTIVLFRLLCFALAIFLIVLLVKALLKYLRSGEVRKEKSEVCKSLGEALKDHRTRCGMTQEFVAESLGVSRQAVSKWENGTSDPSTSNLIAIAKIFGISPGELLQQVRQ